MTLLQRLNRQLALFISPGILKECDLWLGKKKKMLCADKMRQRISFPKRHHSSGL
jgi:hypothetical protein